MISFIARVKPLTVTTESILKSEPFGLLFFSSFLRRTYSTRSSKKNNINKQFKTESDLRIEDRPANLPKRFGSIIELEEHFSDVETQEIRSRTKVFETRRINEKEEMRYLSEQEHEEREEVEEDEDGLVEEYEENEKEDSNVKESTLDRSAYKYMDKNVTLLNSLMVKLKNKKLREKRKEILLEGKRVIYEAIKAGVVPLKIFFSRSADLVKLNIPNDTPCYRIPYRSCKLWGDVTTPQGIFGIFKTPDEGILKNRNGSIPLTVICDQIRDPGNLGAALRVVAAVGCERIILTTGCASVWDPKVLRAACGAHFHFPIIINSTWSDIGNLISKNSKVYVAEGCSELQQNESESNFGFTKICKFSKSLPVYPYHSVEFQKESTVIIIGGEAEGTSTEAYEFVGERKGSRLFIPMMNDMESLNTSVALGVLAFEYKRQILKIDEEESSQQPVNDAASGI